MSEVVAPPDCARLVIDYLKPLLNLPASSTVPKVRPAEFLRVIQVPSEGFIANGLFKAFLSVEAWAQTVPAAATLAGDAVGWLNAATDFYVDCGGPGFLADPDTGQPRYLFTVELWAHGSIL